MTHPLREWREAMLLYALGLIGSIWFEDRPEFLLLLVTLAGVLVGAAGQWGRAGWMRPTAAALIVEELFVTSALFGTFPAEGGASARTGLALVGGLLAFALAPGRPLPDGWLPLHGLWLRRLLAVAALGSLVVGSSWIECWQAWWAWGLPRWPLAPALAVAAWLLTLSWWGLSRGMLPVRRTAGSRSALEALR